MTDHTMRKDCLNLVEPRQFTPESYVDAALQAAIKTGLSYAQDAARYRWLRDRPGAKTADGYGLLVVTDEPNRTPRYIGPVMGVNLDVIIDAAMSETNP